MTTLMRNGRDRRSGKPVKCHAILERVRLFGTRSADYIRASSHNGCIQRPNTWLHPNASLKCQIFSLHRGRRPYRHLADNPVALGFVRLWTKADKVGFWPATVCPLMTIADIRLDQLHRLIWCHFSLAAQSQSARL